MAVNTDGYGLMLGQIKSLKEENAQLKADLRGLQGPTPREDKVTAEALLTKLHDRLDEFSIEIEIKTFNCGRVKVAWRRIHNLGTKEESWSYLRQRTSDNLVGALQTILDYEDEVDRIRVRLNEEEGK